MPIVQSRRRFLTNALAGAAGLGGAGAAGLMGTAESTAGEPPPEIRTIRSKKDAAICEAPRYVAGQLLRAEGFTEFRFVDSASSAEISDAVARNTVDFSSHFGSDFVRAIDAGAPITILAGVHVGCFELFALHLSNHVVGL